MICNCKLRCFTKRIKKIENLFPGHGRKNKKAESRKKKGKN